MITATAQSMKELDNRAIHGAGIPSLDLMERAAEGITREVLMLIEGKENPTVVTFSGPGNNGGDGLAAARLLAKSGVRVTAFLVGKREKMTHDSLANEARLSEVKLSLMDFDPQNEGQLRLIHNADAFVDALFGIGLNSDIRGAAQDAIRLMNESNAPVVAADIASGVQADTGKVLGTAVRAEVTVTFTMPKAGHYVGDGGVCTGRLVVQDIGIPAELVGQTVQDAIVVNRELVRSFLPKRPVDGHKGTFGKDYILAGSRGFTGAPVMAANAAMRAGAGLVWLGVPEGIYPIIAVKCDEVMPAPLEDDGAGHISDSALMTVLDKLSDCDAALIGPGLGRSEEASRLVKYLLEAVNFPIILDADGLNAISENMSVLSARRVCPTILTPHDGEFARLGGDLKDGDRLGSARSFAEKYGCMLVLKGHRTILTLPDGTAFINTTGNDGMAKGGSGDILSGIILGLVGQGIHPVKAAVAAVWLHGRAGDLAAEKLGHYSMLPTDILTYLPDAFREVTDS